LPSLGGQKLNSFLKNDVDGLNAKQNFYNNAAGYMSRNNIEPVGGGSYFTKILNNQDVNAMPKSTKNAYNF
jgi:hypothetical protein